MLTNESLSENPGLNLEQLAKYLNCPPFRPMTHFEWSEFGGANPGTYISADLETMRFIFAEPTGDVGILVDHESGEELNFSVGQSLDGFSPEAVLASAEYVKLCESFIV